MSFWKYLIVLFWSTIIVCLVGGTSWSLILKGPIFGAVLGVAMGVAHWLGWNDACEIFYRKPRPPAV
jgi:hypothetical protein